MIINKAKRPSGPINEGNFSMKKNRLGSYELYPDKSTFDVVFKDDENE